MSKTKKSKTSPKPETHKVTLEFDSKDAAALFFAHWLDGGLDGGGNIDWDTNKWDQERGYMRIEGSGYPVDSDGTVLTPEVQQKRFNARLAKVRNQK